MITVTTDQQTLQRKAATLIEALPYMKKYAGETFVIKYGGHAMGDADLARQFAEDVVLLKQVGINPVIVHGGGPQIGSMLKRLGVQSEFIDGLRVTDAATVEIAEMVLCGSINKSIVADLNAAGGRAIGLSGKDSDMVLARKVSRTKRDPDSNIEQVIDLGFVGEPCMVDPTFLKSSMAAGIIPVIAPIAMGEDGKTYNINADTMAGAIAGALKARRFFLLTDVAGVMDKEKNLLTELGQTDIEELIADGTISGGMIPKVETCLMAVEAGVRGAVILDGRVTHAILLEIFTERGAGTMIRA
ncbi:acetylglutamate kinase [Gimibacter soli]|uniref:Acetylglutamate kinase n=1 Tax=Gimibacter soli TaxID=3024400 RepID=A0AAE9XTJ5_9PROT|nr:acetylglutamate kinase [Gimibacter soli]WCL54925.1 acetylglutamate kinase [Gimibacter soli]